MALFSAVLKRNASALWEVLSVPNLYSTWSRSRTHEYKPLGRVWRFHYCFPSIWKNSASSLGGHVANFTPFSSRELSRRRNNMTHAR